MTTTNTRILDGKWLSSRFQAEIRTRVEILYTQYGRRPGLGVLLVGDNPASHAYVKNKEKLAAACGLETFDKRLPANCSEQEVREALGDFNRDPRIDGILMQLPLPKHLPTNALLDLIDPEKDADGLHPLNQGLLLRGEGKLRPCTPMGCLHLLDLAFSDCPIGGEDFLPSSLSKADLSGKHAVVLGRSILVGKPVGMLLLERNATVTFAHSKTADLPRVVKEADIVVAAVGIPNLLQGAWVKETSVVIDVGINRQPDGKLVGDVDFASVMPRVKAITPVPGGVGSMTVVMLIQNTLKSFEARTAGR